MFDRFTTETKDLMNRARQESVRLRHEYLGPEHIFLGMLAMPESTGVAILRACGVDPQDMRAEVERIVSPGPNRPVSVGQLPFTASAKKVLELTMAEGAQHEALTVGHVLIALASVPGSIPATVLADRSVSVETLRTQVAAQLIVAPGDRPPLDGGRRLQLLRDAVAVLRAVNEPETAIMLERAIERLA